MMIPVMVVTWFGISIEACLVCNTSSVQSNSEPAVQQDKSDFLHPIPRGSFTVSIFS
ncbi:hypothetical protein BO78DRAFT_394536 [Aspergillus sclerotiicarbonarius CBS 121057]|uniref:Uncharacterized protein n=1 Tax=Aspergillus sclerotiicarbonarius (strain CBS 121057 / IBT 28362) TaxID=1448318 RepID=A0A319F3E4_ASPSB|nr:hypothetical protein BO78DRAFT_394536 [Aspergillus sclerotiicarbonarius CBS 121057]